MMPRLVVLIGATGFLMTFWVVIVQYNFLEQSALSPYINFYINSMAKVQGYYR